jgi:hypothetical protein
MPIDLNTLLQAVMNAESSLQAAEVSVADAQERRQMAAEALAREQGAFDRAVADARTLARPSAAVSADTGYSRLAQDAKEPEGPPPCPECGQPAPAGHACRRMEGAPGPLPANSPAHSWAAGIDSRPGFGPEADDDREDRTGVD